jgi:hypothetical protein
MKHLLTTILVAFLSIACGNQRAENFAVSDAFTAEQLESIVAAADEWCERSGKCVELHVVPDADIPKIDNWSTISIGSDAQCTRTQDGQLHRVGAITDVHPMWLPRIYMCQFGAIFPVAVKHEMAHAISGRDDHTSHGIMAPVWDHETFEITSVDVEYIDGGVESVAAPDN